MATVTDHIEARFEQVYPFALGLAAVGACLKWGDTAFAYMQSAQWNVAALYGAVFDIAAVFTAFLFTFFSFFVTTDRGFIGRAKGSLPFRRTVEYTLSALILGALLTAFTIPLLVVEPVPVTFGIQLAGVAAWCGLAIWALAAFVRAASIFAIFARQHL